MSVQNTTVAVIDGKATYDGRTLASWAPDVAQRIVERRNRLDGGSVRLGGQG